MPDNVEISPNNPESIQLSGRISGVKPCSRRRRIFTRIVLALLFLLLFLFIAACVLWINRNLVMEEFLRHQIAQRGFEAQLTVDEITDNEARLRNLTLSQKGEFIASADKIEISYLWPNIKSGEIVSVNLEGMKAAISLDEAGQINNEWLPKNETGAAIDFPSGGVSLKGGHIELSTPYGNVDIKGDILAKASDKIDLDMSFEAGELRYQDIEFNVADKGGYFKGGLSGKQINIEQLWAQFDAVSIGGADGGAGVTASSSEPINLKANGVLSLPTDAQLDAQIEANPAIIDDMADYKFEGRLDLAGMNVDHPNIGASAAQGAFEGGVHYNVHSGAFDVQGLFEARAGRAQYLKELASPYAKAQDLSVSYQGQIAKRAETSSLLLSGELGFDAQDLGFSNHANARNLAEQIAVHETLSVTPVAENFHADITAQIAQIFEGAQARARLSIDHDEAGYRLGLSEALQLQGLRERGVTAQNSLTIRAAAEPFLTFNAAQKRLDLRADLALSGARELDVNALKLSAASKNGFSLLGVQSVTGVISSRAEWREPEARLAPFRVDLTYTAKNEGGKKGVVTDFAVKMDLDYDGPFLNSKLTGLKANGRLSREGRGANSAIWFDPSVPIQIDNVVTQTGWGAQNVKAMLEGGAPIFTLMGGAFPASLIELPLEQLSAAVYDDKGEKSFAVTAHKAKVTGNQSIAEQSWEAVFSGFDVRSETTPGPGSQLNSSDMTLSLTRAGETADDEADLAWRYKLQTEALTADLAQLKLDNLGVELNGQGSDFTAHYQGGTAQIKGADLPPLPMTGQASYQGGALSGTAKTAMPRAAQFPIYASYLYENGSGTADLDIPEFIFSPQTIQPAELAPALRGKIAQVSGLASAKVTLGYKLGEGVTSSGSVTLTDMDIGTLVGPFTGVNTTLNLDDLLPLRTHGTQTITMKGFNPALPLGEGVVSFDVVEGGIALREARWPLNTGHIYIEPTKWDTNGRLNRIIVRVENVSLGELVGEIGNENISATGLVSGVLPIIIDGVSVLVEDGNLSVKEGGVLRVRTEGLDAAGASNETAKIAIDALKEFEYKELSLDINGPLDGDMVVGAVFSGKNADVLGGADFLFRVNIEGELINIAKSFARNAKVEEFLRVLDEELR